MKRTKQISIEGFNKDFTVNELTVAQVMELFDNEDLLADTSIEGLKRTLAQLLPEFSNITLEDMKRMAPSELRELWEGFKEVNSDFFEVSRALGLTTMLETIKQGVMSDFSKLLVSLLKPDTPESSITDTHSSATQ